MEDGTKITPRTLPEALGSYAGKRPARFHMPGHKGRGMDGFWRDDLISWDVTEVSGTDNLHMPCEAIKTAQASMADAYHAAASFFVVNGSTAAVQAMLLALSPDDRLLLSRDAHRSAASGLALSGIETEYLVPPYDATSRLAGLVTPALLESRLTETRATAVLLTSPNYYGMCADIPALSDVAHAHGALLLVDAAHGAHFPFSPLLPTALGPYADLFAHSQHKTMDALTQAASLHLGRCRIDSARVQKALAMIETSSPSYLLLSSLDWSVYMGARRNWSGHVLRMRALAARIGGVPGLSVLSKQLVQGAAEQDETRLVIDVSGLGLCGYTAGALLEKANVYVEMADARRIVCITSPSDDPMWYEQLYLALSALETREAAAYPGADEALAASVFLNLPERRMSPREATFAKLASIPLSEAAGRVAGEPFGAYPPGVSLVFPGEIIPETAVEYLIKEERAGATPFGVRDGRVFVVA